MPRPVVCQRSGGPNQRRCGGRFQPRCGVCLAEKQIMLIVDTYNVLHVTGVLPPGLAGPEVDDLAGLIDASRFSGRRALLVCDGSGEGRTVFGCQVVFAGPGRDADTLIARLVARWRHGRTLTVVSSDREVKRGAERVGARVVGSGEFLRQLTEDSEAGSRRRGRESTGGNGGREGRLTGAEIGWWLMEFGVVDAVPGLQSTSLLTDPHLTDPPGRTPPAIAPSVGSPPTSSLHPTVPPEKVTPPGGRGAAGDFGSRSGTGGDRAARVGDVCGSVGGVEEETTSGSGMRRGNQRGDHSSGGGSRGFKKASTGTVRGAGDGAQPVTDPVLLDAFRHWASGIDPSDLDMERWLRLFPPPTLGRAGGSGGVGGPGGSGGDEIERTSADGGDQRGGTRGGGTSRSAGVKGSGGGKARGRGGKKRSG